MAPRDRPDRSAQWITDVAQLRALAHPLRGQMLRRLRTHGPATASDMARTFDESSGTTSYHLRQLARHGFVIADEHQPSRREKRWRAVVAMTAFVPGAHALDPAGWEAETALLRRQVQGMAVRGEHWLATRDRWPEAWVRAADASDYLVRLTPAALQRLTEEVGRLVAEAEKDSAGDPGARLATVFLHAVPEPLDPDDPPASTPGGSSDPSEPAALDPPR